MKRFFVLASLAIVILYQIGCSSDEEQADLEMSVADSDETEMVGDETETTGTLPIVGQVKLENMYESEARNLTSESPLEMITVLEGTTKTKLQVRFRGVRDFGFGFPLYECEWIDDSAEELGGIAQGMSGTPVGPPGRVIGALAYADFFSKPPYRFWVTSIDAMEASVDHQTFGQVLAEFDAPDAPNAALNATYAPVKTPIMVTGIQPRRMQELASHLTDSRFQSVELFAHIGAAPDAVFSEELSAGDMIGVALVTGDVVNSIGFGTVTQMYGDKFVAFGHSMFGDGKAALPVYRAVVDGIVPNLQAAYKSVSVSGDPIGTITKDLTPAIVGELGTLPEMIPMDISYHPANRDTPVKKYHEIAYGQEWSIPAVAALTVDAVRMEVSAGTLSGEITLEFQETDTVFTEPFWSVSPDPFFDLLLRLDSIVHGFTDIITNSAGKATLEKVSIDITDTPQISTAVIESVSGPDEIKRGTSATFSIVLVPHWSSAGEERTIEEEITLDIPDDFPSGGATLEVSGAGSLDFFDSLFFFDFDDFEFENEIPKSLDELIEQTEESQTDPSLIKVKLESSDGFSEDVEAEVELDGFIVTGSNIEFVTIQE